MKKIIIALLCCAMLTLAASCNKESNVELDDNYYTHQHNNTSQDTETSPCDQNDLVTDSNSLDSSNVCLYSQYEFYNIFQEAINSNAYDKWLKTQLSKANSTDKEIYAEYLSFWKNELTFTIECGKSLFDDVDIYNQWKYNLEQWVLFSQETLKLEMNSFDTTMPQLEVIIPYCELIRQKVIDTKYFLYYLEFETTGNNREIVINWSPIVETLNN